MIESEGKTQAGRPFTISRVFVQGEIGKFAHPRINGWPADV